MKTAIVYYSMSGNTKYVADKIAERIEADMIRIDPVKAYPDKGAKKFIWGGKSAVMGETPALRPYEFNVEKYDGIILGSPVWAGNFAPPVRTFIKENPNIQGKKFSYSKVFDGLFENPSWCNDTGEPNWCEFMMYDRAKNSDYPMLLAYKYFNDKENDEEVERRMNYEK